MSLLEEYSKAVSHLHRARKRGRLGLILGAGISSNLHIPRWETLIDRLEAKLPYITPDRKAPLSYRAEQLFQAFRAGQVGRVNLQRDNFEAVVGAAWRGIVAESLYQHYNIGDSRNEADYDAAIRNHPYLRELATVVAPLQIAITHNFDDALERAIDANPTLGMGEGRRYHSFWKPEPFLRPGLLNIYHPNGYTPFKSEVRGSDRLVLTEASFADHLANTNDLESHFLVRHLSDRTWLILGHSLADATLKNALRMHSNHRPGHVGYFIHWIADDQQKLTDQQRQAIRDANFDTYNLITIFATNADVKELLRLIALDEVSLRSECADLGIPSQYRYYIVGSVSSGKSTILGHLRNLETIEEWPGKMPTTMNKQSDDVEPDEQTDMDAKLAEAIWRKNEEVGAIGVGIVAIDRAPLDYMAFPQKTENSIVESAKNRTHAVLHRFSSNDYVGIHEGQIILIRAETASLIERQLQRGGRLTPEKVESGEAKSYLDRQKKLMELIYKEAVEQESLVDADCCLVATSTKDAARLIHFGEYKPMNFAERLKQILNGEV